MTDRCLTACDGIRIFWQLTSLSWLAMALQKISWQWQKWHSLGIYVRWPPSPDICNMMQMGAPLHKANNPPSTLSYLSQAAITYGFRWETQVPLLSLHLCDSLPRQNRPTLYGKIILWLRQTDFNYVWLFETVISICIDVTSLTVHVTKNCINITQRKGKHTTNN